MIRDKLSPILGDLKAGLYVIAFTAIALGLVYVGSCNEDISLPRKAGQCGGYYSGNVLKVQHFLSQCAQHLEKGGESFQGPAVLGIGMVAMAEELGLDMVIRSLEHLLQYGEQNIRKAVPLALGLLSISNPKVHVMDTLSRLTHDADTKVAMCFENEFLIKAALF
ncbi:hypothetical protein Lser_V15G17043 [Lactuca serriola]